ncbi:hypothetical protein BH11VER1_BH11VER1_02190 [soil metagenome]
MILSVAEAKKHGLRKIHPATLLRMRSCFYTVLQGFFLAVTACVPLQAQPTSLEKLTGELLDVRVEAPDWQEYLRVRLKEGWVPPPLPDHTPPDDAPIIELVQYWQIREWGVAHTVKPSEKVAARLRDSVETNPASFPLLRVYFDPENTNTVARVQQWFAKLPDDVLAEDRQSIENWLILEAKVLPELLRQRAIEAFDHPADRSKQEALNFLMQHHWPEAEQMLQRFASSDQAGARGLALISLYQHSLSDPTAKDGERIRAELQKFVEGQEVPDVRANALEALNEPDWPGRAEWILERFKDESLSKIERESHSSYPTTVLCAIVKLAPDFWVPKVLPLVGNANRTVHNNAVSCLVQLELEELGVEVTRALLPWLSNPDWAVSVDPYGRIGVIYALRHVVMPESVSGLMWVLEHGDDYTVSGAAQALAHQDAKESVPALKKALAKESDEYHRRHIIQALLKLNGFTDAEKTEAVVVYALQVSTKEGSEALAQASMGLLPVGTKKPPLSPQLSVGEAISDIKEQDDTLVKQLLERAKEISAKQPDVAQKIREIIGGWSTDSSLVQLIEQLRSGELTKETVQVLLSDRARFAKPLAAVDDLKGGASVIQALVTGDQKRIAEILQGNDPSIQALLCACARLDRTPLSLPDVAKLMTAKDTSLARAAELYLECIDSEESRARLLEHRRGEAQILGASDGMFNSKRFASYYFGGLEKYLSQKVLAKDGPDEIYVLMSSGTWGGNGQCFIERRGDRATLVNEQYEERLRTRDLSKEEWQTLRQFLTTQQTDDLPALNLSVCDGIQYEYLRLTKDGGRRVFMNNPGSYRRSMEMPGGPTLIKEGDPDDTVYAALVDQFQRLTLDASKFRVGYRAQEQLPGLRVLIPSETSKIQAVMQERDQLIVYAQSPDEAKARWRVFKDGQVESGTIAGPMGEPERGGLPESFMVADHLVNEPWRASLDDGLVLPALDSEKQDGLWIASFDRAPKLLTKGDFASPLVTFDKRWVVAAKRLGETWAEPNSVVRIDAKSGAETEIRIEPADTLQPIAVLPGHGKVLIHRMRDPAEYRNSRSKGPEQPEHWLYDADTGKVERVSGEFNPLHDQTWRPLQPTSQPHIVWAALRLKEENSVTTQVGRYDLQQFKFDPVLTLPGLRFTSMDIWVDEKAKLVYITVNGDLLSVPLP